MSEHTQIPNPNLSFAEIKISLTPIEDRSNETIEIKINQSISKMINAIAILHKESIASYITHLLASEISRIQAEFSGIKSF